jgi:L-amino acid N-acyltransferase YncA
VIVRAATAGDADAIAAIYAPYVLTGTASFELEPPTPAAMRARIEKVLVAGAPWLLAEDATGPLGYAYCAQFRDRPAYAHACESSVYVRPGDAGRGIGRALMQALFAEAFARGFRQMIAVVGDSGNIASLRLHESLGFRQAGTLTDVGLKFGRLLDVVYLQRAL